MRSAYYGIVATVAILPGYLVAFRILHWKNGPERLFFSPRAAASIVVISLAITAVLLMIFVPRERAARAEAGASRMREARPNGETRSPHWRGLCPASRKAAPLNGSPGSVHPSAIRCA